MEISSIRRLLSSSIPFKNPNFSFPFTTVSSTEKYWTHLQKNYSNPEKTLNRVGVKLDTLCVNEVLQRCALNQPLLGLRFFIWAGLQPNYRHSLYMYSKACKVFEINRNPRVVTDVIETYRVEGCLVNIRTFKVVLNLCREAKLADEGLWVLRKMKEFNCRPDTTMYNVVIRLYCEMGEMEVAVGLMREMGLIDLYPDMITYVALIKGFCNANQLEDACGMFKVMRGHGCLPNTVAYSALLDGFCRFGNVERALELLREMETECGDCNPNVVTYTSIIQSFCEKGRSTEALGILDQMGACGFAPNRVTIINLIKGLCTEGRVEEAYKLIDKVVAGGSVSNDECYSSLVISLLQIKKLEEAEKLFRRMLASAVKPDGMASGSLIRRLCLEGRVLDGFHLYDEIERLGCLTSIDSDIYSVLLAGLCQGSYLMEAAKLARMMVERGIQLKAPYVDNIVKHLKNSGEDELVSNAMAIELCSDNSGMVMSPRISLSYGLSQMDVAPVEQHHFRSNTSSSSIDFDFCVLESFDLETSSADELFSDGKILPVQIKKKIVPPKQIHRLKPPIPPSPPPLLSDRRDVDSCSENSKNESLKETKKTSSEPDEKQSCKSFWGFKRSSSLNCVSGYARNLCPLPLLSRSNSTGSTPNVKHHLQKNQPDALLKPSQSSSSSSGSIYQKPPLKKSYGAYGNGVRINPVLNVPANFFGLGSIFSSSGKDKIKRK
ncbi:hypothetical protein F0562_004221 [Nyssa sinensis]|uniref:Pentacotripeptide-repeat region of PRORP domain-containing protein n=1 Tax=Nyssa sinensis TaxID=561372 RepID=A0A5J5C1K5_9ASTE|nr:hypothetical protein F0562_004221 [Nyssa sinensis]